VYIEKKPIILVVDDEKEIREAISRHFRFLGYEIETAENGKIALQILQDKRIDVIISDIKMPVMDGIELLREVKLIYPLTHVIMITGYVTQENVLSCMRHGADTCIYKPISDMSELETAIEDAFKTLARWQTKLRVLTEMKK